MGRVFILILFLTILSPVPTEANLLWATDGIVGDRERRRSRGATDCPRQLAGNLITSAARAQRKFKRCKRSALRTRLQNPET